jgi:hypothetical protein
MGVTDLTSSTQQLWIHPWKFVMQLSLEFQESPKNSNPTSFFTFEMPDGGKKADLQLTFSMTCMRKQWQSWGATMTWKQGWQN